jgi:hypothetical protein
VARDAPTFIFGPRKDAVFLPQVGAVGGGGDLMLIGPTGDTNRAILAGTGVDWYPGPTCNGCTGRLPTAATLAGLGPVIVAETATYAMEFEEVNGNWIWQPICNGGCQPAFVTVHAVTANEDGTSLHALASDDAGCASFWAFDGVEWTLNPSLALCEQIPYATMFPYQDHIYAVVGPDKLVDGTDGTVLAFSDPEGDGPTHVQLEGMTAAYDARLDRVVLAGDCIGIASTPVLTGTMVFEPGSAGRASALFQVTFSEAGANAPQLDRVAVSVHSPNPNLTVSVFDGEKDVQLPRDPNVAALYAASGTGLDRYLTGTPPSLLVRVRNSDGTPTAAVGIDAIEAVLEYTEVLP